MIERSRMSFIQKLHHDTETTNKKERKHGTQAFHQ